MSHYIFSSNQAAKAEMVKTAMITFDFRRYMRKFVDRVDILVDQELITFYDQISKLARTWVPNEIIDDFATSHAFDFDKYD